MRVLCILLIAGLMAGCQLNNGPSGRGYQTTGADPSRDTETARIRTAAASKLIKSGRLEEAERELRAALAADLFFGPAHNNLGTVYFRQKRFYQAAWEYQYAAKLMPNKAEPLYNLGLVMEAVGKLSDAVKCYEDAVQADPDYLEGVGGLARAYIRSGRRDAKTRDLLSQILLRDTRPEWLAWAREQTTMSGQPAADVTSRPSILRPSSVTTPSDKP